MNRKNKNSFKITTTGKNYLQHLPETQEEMEERKEEEKPKVSRFQKSDKPKKNKLRYE